MSERPAGAAALGFVFAGVSTARLVRGSGGGGDAGLQRGVEGEGNASRGEVMGISEFPGFLACPAGGVCCRRRVFCLFFFSIFFNSFPFSFSSHFFYMFALLVIMFRYLSVSPHDRSLSQRMWLIVLALRSHMFFSVICQRRKTAYGKVVAIRRSPSRLGCASHVRASASHFRGGTSRNLHRWKRGVSLMLTVLQRQSEVA